MKKRLLAYITLLGGLLFSQCRQLDLEPKGIMGEAELFGTEYGVKMYFAGLYNYLPIEDFQYYANNGYHRFNWDTEKNSQGAMSGEYFNTWISVDNDGFGYWPYDRIREVNNFIQSFPNYKDKFPEGMYNKLLGEAHFLRAYFYFGLAKRYGGVPIVTEVQDPLAGPEVLNVSRNTEYDTWKFIHDDLQFAIDNMETDTKETGRANKYVAAALMSRTMLYAGSIAKYTESLGFKATELAAQQGLAGMEPSQANEFFQYAVDAGKLVESGPYSLYNQNADKAVNFASLFLDPGSPETIFVKEFDKNSPNDNVLKHNYDALMSPAPDMSSFVGSESYVPLDFMELYDMPAYTNPDGTPVRFDSRSDIRNGMEPRALGTMYLDGDELRGHTFEIQRGIYRTFDGVASDIQRGVNSAPINSNGNRILGAKGATTEIDGVTYKIAGDHGNFENVGGSENALFGSAYIRKYINPDMPTSEVNVYRSDQSWVVFRLGEIYLNTAEALYELGQRDEAFDYIAKIRERAGAKVVRPAIDMTMTNIGTINKANYTYSLEKSLQFIRDERQRE
ncbi:MAG: RagB/SusD family nutrient uptake outer membrane protein, partial [Parapedobacter sp.]